MIFSTFYKISKCTDLRTTPIDQYFLGVEVRTTPFDQYFLGVGIKLKSALGLTRVSDAQVWKYPHFAGQLI